MHTHTLQDYIESSFQKNAHTYGTRFGRRISQQHIIRNYGAFYVNAKINVSGALLHKLGVAPGED